MLLNIWGLAFLVILDGLRRHALIGLVFLALAMEAGGLLFFDFIPRDIGRASVDFILSVGWLAGFLFLFFHAVQAMAWDEERRTIHTIMARPISRSQYVLGLFFGLALLLLLLNCILASLGYGVLELIKGSVKAVLFPELSAIHYLLAWFGLFCIELAILSIILLFSGMVRGGFPVLLLSISYYFICSGLPVVRDAFAHSVSSQMQTLEPILVALTVIFPDFSRFDFKTLVAIKSDTTFIQFFSTDSLLLTLYVAVVLRCAALIYERRDLQ